jgi:hypothetical protein
LNIARCLRDAKNQLIFLKNYNEYTDKEYGYLQFGSEKYTAGK